MALFTATAPIRSAAAGRARPGAPAAVRANNNRNNASLPRAGD